MKRKWIAMILMLAAFVLLLASCGSGNEEYHNITAQSNVYSMGTQSVTLESNSLNDAPEVVFKSSISPADIVLGDALEGKTVTKVTYNSSSSVTLELSGNTKAAGGANVIGSITVKHSGLESKGDSVCHLNVLAPEIRVVSAMSNMSQKDGVTVYQVVSTFTLPVGEFTDAATAENITLAEGITGELSVVLADGNLKVTLKNCNMKNPEIHFAANVTTVEKEATVILGSFTGADFH